MYAFSYENTLVWTLPESGHGRIVDGRLIEGVLYYDGNTLAACRWQCHKIMKNWSYPSCISRATEVSGKNRQIPLTLKNVEI